MKKKFALLLACFFVYAYGNAKIWRVNNNSNVKADFTSIQTAHDNASSGDTIYLESSATSYGTLSSSKKLTIIGGGFFLDQNPSTQALALPAYVSNISFNVGSEGSLIMGCDFNGSNCYVYCDDIVIRRNKFSSAYGENVDNSVGTINIEYLSNNGNLGVSNIIISQNFGCRITNSRASNGILITNNFITYHAGYGDLTANTCLEFHSGTVALIQNNIFRRGTVLTYNSSLTNNIMIKGFVGGTGNLISNNICNLTQFETGNKNLQNTDMTTVFVGSGSVISDDGRFKLKAGSPAIGAGYGSTVSNPVDAGIFGGNFPFVLSGIPPIPSIYYFQNQPVGSNSDPIKVVLKVKSNN